MTDDPGARAAHEARVAERYDVFMACVAASHAPELVALDVTMAQVKALYLVSARGTLHISALAELLGVTLSTGSGLVDRLVDHGLLERRHDTADRRHVVVRITPTGTELLERMRELGSRRVRSLLGALDDADLAAFARILDRFIDRVAAENRLIPESPALATAIAPAATPAPSPVAVPQEGAR
ncbi:MAG: MarR family transcriptional regulator [Chloroflexota bacterium]